MEKVNFAFNNFLIFFAAFGIILFIDLAFLAQLSFGINLSKKGTKGAQSSFDKVIIFASEKYNIPIPFLIAVMRAESDFNVYAVSPKGAIGLMQIMPKTAKTLNLDINNPLINIVAGAKYLHYCLRRFDYKPVPALACYNAGPGSVKTIYVKNLMKFIIPPYRQTELYILKVHRYYNFYRKLLKR